jgi:hypothetical protein
LASGASAGNCSVAIAKKEASTMTASS